MPWLVLEAEALNGRWSVSDFWRRDQAAWPPSFDTAYSALTAAAAGAGWGEVTQVIDVAETRHGRVLRALEMLGSPDIAAPLDPPRVEGMTWYVPVADHPGVGPTRSLKARHHNSIGYAGPVRWGWLVEPAVAAQLQPLLDEIARQVTRIGSSRGPVIASVHVLEDKDWHATLVPAEKGGRLLRCVYPGRLADLERWFRAGERPSPGPAVAYSRPGELPIAAAWQSMIVLRKREGIRLGIERTVEIAEAVRLALLAHLGNDASELLCGHGAQGAPTRREHLAIMPLARVGVPFADGTILGIGLLLPEQATAADDLFFMRSLGRWVGAGGRLTIGGKLAWTLEFAVDEQRHSLNAGRYSRSSTDWATVSPVVLDRHPRASPGRSVEAIVAAMCQRSGLPEPATVRASPSSSLVGTAISRAYGLATREYLTGRYITHLQISWSRPVPGPILLGGGRYFGLGLLLPKRSPAAAGLTSAAA